VTVGAINCLAPGVGGGCSAVPDPTSSGRGAVPPLAAHETVDIVRDLRQQGYDPKVLRRVVTRTYSDWEEFDE